VAGGAEQITSRVAFEIVRDRVDAPVVFGNRPGRPAGFVLGAVETSAIGRMFAQKHGYRFDANQELLAIGAGNLMAGLGRGFPVSGGMSQSLVNESAGARTPMSGLIAAIFTLIVAVFALGLLRNLPQPVLAGIVLVAVMSLVDFVALRHIWHFSRAEFLVAIVAFLGVLGSGPCASSCFSWARYPKLISPGPS
jgi:SulP family sulfate permease